MGVDFTAIPFNMDYPVIIRGTLWNGFQHSLETAFFQTYAERDLGRMIVLFPNDRVPRRFAFWSQSPWEPKKPFAKG